MRKIGPLIFVVMASGLAVALASPPPGNETVNYTYDTKGRVVKVEHSSSVNGNLVANYSYDDSDNRLNVNVSGAP